MTSPASNTAQDGQTSVRGSEARQEAQNNARIVTDTAHPGLVIPREQPPAFSNETSSLADTGSDTVPEYTLRPDDPTAPHLPSSARATGSHPTEEERLASLREFVKDKQHSADYFGGQEGKPEGPPKDPFKVFRWAKAKVGGEEGDVWRRMSVEETRKWEEQGRDADPDLGEIVKGDVDTHRIL